MDDSLELYFILLFVGNGDRDQGWRWDKMRDDPWRQWYAEKRASWAAHSVSRVHEQQVIMGLHIWKLENEKWKPSEITDNNLFSLFPGAGEEAICFSD